MNTKYFASVQKSDGKKKVKISEKEIDDLKRGEEKRINKAREAGL